MRAIVRLAPRLATVLLATSLACGGGDEPEPTGPPMLAPPLQKAKDNQPPVIESIRFEPKYPARGDRVRAVLRTRDPEGDSLEIGYAWKVDGEKLRSDGAEVHLSPEGTVSPGKPVTVTVDAEDPDGDELHFRYRWTVNDGRVPNQLSSLPTGDLSDGDVIQVEVIASDGDSETPSLRSAAVRVARANAPPAIVSQPSQDQPGEEFHYAVEAWDPDGDRVLRYSLRRAPAGMTIDSVLGEISWRPKPEQIGEHAVEVVVQDSKGAFSVQLFQLRIGEPLDAPPADVAE
jgi:hypothetical protein